MSKTKVNITTEDGKSQVGVYDEKTHLIKTSDGKLHKPKNVKVKLLNDK